MVNEPTIHLDETDPKVIQKKLEAKGLRESDEDMMKEFIGRIAMMKPVYHIPSFSASIAEIELAGIIKRAKEIMEALD